MKPRRLVCFVRSKSHCFSAMALLSQARCSNEWIVEIVDYSCLDAAGSSIAANYDDRVKVLSACDLGFRKVAGGNLINYFVNGGGLMLKRFQGKLAGLFQGGVDAVLLLRDSNVWDQAIVSEAHRHKIPTFLLQEGPLCSLGKVHGQTAIVRALQVLKKILAFLGVIPPFNVDGLGPHNLVLVASEYYRKRWISNGADPRKVKVVGIPRFDGLREIGRKISEGEKSAFIFIHQPFERHRTVSVDACAAAYRDICDALNKIRNDFGGDLIIRLHPKSELSDLNVFRQLLDSEFKVQHPDGPLLEGLVNAKLAFGFYSGALLEAAVCGVPVLSYLLPEAGFSDAREASKPRDIQRLGIPCAVNAAEIVRLSYELLSGKRTVLSSIENEVGCVDGNSASRTLREISLSL